MHAFQKVGGVRENALEATVYPNINIAEEDDSVNQQLTLMNIEDDVDSIDGTMIHDNAVNDGLMINVISTPVEEGENIEEQTPLECVSKTLAEMKNKMDEIKNKMDEMDTNIKANSQLISDIKYRNKYIYGDKIGPKIPSHN